jgi:hypothetical protein
LARLHRIEVVFNGGEDVLKALEVLGAVDNVEMIDFHNVIPYPEQYRAMDERARKFAAEFERITHKYERVATRTKKMYDLTQKFGVPPDTMRLPTGLENGGFEWQLENWGSSNPENVIVRKVKGDIGWYANLSFITDLGMPIKVFLKLSELCKQMSMWFVAKQTWNNIEHHMTIRQGAIQFKITRKGFPVFIGS